MDLLSLSVVTLLNIAFMVETGFTAVKPKVTLWKTPIYVQAVCFAVGWVGFWWTLSEVSHMCLIKIGKTCSVHQRVRYKFVQTEIFVHGMNTKVSAESV